MAPHAGHPVPAFHGEPESFQSSAASTRIVSGGRSPVAIAPDGTWLASGGSDGTVRIWAADSTPRATHTGRSRPMNAVGAVAITPDGTWLASGSGDRTVRIWASAVPATKAHSVTAIRVDDTVLACAWLAGGAETCIAITGAFTGSRCNRCVNSQRRTAGNARTGASGCRYG
jgi:WD40 repeat protein